MMELRDEHRMVVRAVKREMTTLPVVPLYPDSLLTLSRMTSSEMVAIPAKLILRPHRYILYL
jgi:hypothetical protein